MREIEELQNILGQATIRQPGTPVKLPKTSHLLDEFLTMNSLNALHEDDRQRMAQFLATVKAKSPVLHLSFAADPSPRFLQHLMTYLRQNIHPLALVQVGMQPNLGAGCMLRTTNKVFDLSLRQFFKAQHGLLLQQIHGSEVTPAPAAQPEQPAVPAQPQPVVQVESTATSEGPTA